MQLATPSVSLVVDDVIASASFLMEHFDFHAETKSEAFAALRREDVDLRVVFLRRGLQTLPQRQRDQHQGGVTLSFVVDDFDGALARVKGAGLAVTMSLSEEEVAGRKTFQVEDPNGVVIQIFGAHSEQNKPEVLG